ncbi:MAG TPA: substrate-binding domain-containing protein [Actinomycetota bacterium]|nr:substrate-binding domain-containing protein [Actinomycetota bacterium]
MSTNSFLFRGRRLAMSCVLISTLILATAARADNVALGSEYCDGKAQAATGEGSLSQSTVHSQLFAGAFSANCPSESGLVSFLGTSDPAGINSLLLRQRHFAGAEVPLTTTQKTQIESVPSRLSLVHQIPLYIEGLAIAYNVPCAPQQLKLRSSVLSAIYSGTITRWNDPLLQIDNPGIASCALPIILTKRETGAGTTVTFQDYLSKRNPQWTPYRRGLMLQPWPTLNFPCTGIGDNPGMVGCVADRVGAIGYLRMADAQAAGLPVAAVENVTADFVTPSAQTCGAAAAAAVTPPGVNGENVPPTFEGMPTRTPAWPATYGDWSSASMTDAPSTPATGSSYPICGFSFAFVLQSWQNGYGGSVSGFVTRSVVDYLTVALMPSTQGQLPGFNLAPLPPNVRKISQEGVRSISLNNFTSLGF